MPAPLNIFTIKPSNIPVDQLATFRHIVLQRGNDDAVVPPRVGG